MEKREFEEIMQTVIDQFGEKHFSNARIKLIYRAVMDITKQELQHVVDDIIGNMKFAPTVEDFKDRSKAFLNGKKKTIYECGRCDNSGLVSLYYKKTGINYAFRCSCVNGNQYKAFSSLPVNLNDFSKVALGKINRVSI